MAEREKQNSLNQKKKNAQGIWVEGGVADEFSAD